MTGAVPGPGSGETWFDEAAGPLVRPYAVTNGRTRAAHDDLNMITRVVATTDRPGPGLGPEHEEIVRRCQQPISIAEIAAALNLPLGVTKVLVSDLVERGTMTFRSPYRSSGPADPELLRAVLDGISRL